MLKAGLIVGGATLVLGLVGGFVFPLACIPCVAALGGLAAGYLAGQFDGPGASGVAARIGAQSGAIAGVGALLAHLISGIANAVMVGPGAATELARAFGLDTGDVNNPAAYYGGAIGGACCLGIGELVLMTALGALAGLLWFQIAGSKAAPPAAM